MLNRLKKNDCALALTLLLLSLLPLIFVNPLQATVTCKLYAEVSVDNKIIERIDLQAAGDDYFLTIPTEHGYNTLHINERGIAVSDADCPDKICLHTGFISKKGELIACVPHRLLIIIKEAEP